MELAIIGLPQSGKTTLFQALTLGHGETATSIGPHIGVVKVPDPRLETLTNVLHPKRIVPAEVRYRDTGAAPKGLGKGEGFGPPHVAQMAQSDALIHVAPAFVEDQNPEDSVSTIDMELAFSDMVFIERRLQRLATDLKGAKGTERDAALREETLLLEIKASLEADIPLRQQNLTREQTKLIENYPLLTAKPMLLVFNIGEKKLPQAHSLEKTWRDQFCARHREVAALCCRLEMELATLEESEAREFRADLGLEEAATNQVIRLSYQLLSLITFFTVVSGEIRAWSIRQGTNALTASGKIHSDMERGFIRSEVIGCDELIKYGSMAEARRHGAVRSEGKSYIVKDGDVMTVLFNV
ncbi:MAG: redox-regulated ATPase YchF [Chloroflexi bacterium]|nr:redox-regulated ATPase YchF [Chloroflexota bacterium]